MIRPPPTSHPPCPPHLHPVLNPLPGVQLINLCSDHCVPLIPALPPQVVLINAVRDVAKALTELIGATKCAAGKAADDPSMYQLKSAAKVKEKKKTRSRTSDRHTRKLLSADGGSFPFLLVLLGNLLLNMNVIRLIIGEVGIIASDLETELTKSQYLRST